jgi:rRNA maturation protein Nop10
MKLQKCPNCKTYTLELTCKKCKKPTKQAGYKFKEYSKHP